MNINEKLQHLTSKEISDLIDRYYNNEKVSDLIAEFKINCKASELVKLFPVEEFDDILCTYCNDSMIRKKTSRGSAKGHIYCYSCLHRFNDVNCSCDNCKNEKQGILIEEYQPKENIDINELSLKDRVYIATLLRGLEWDEDNDKINIYPLQSSDKKLAPTISREIEILRELSSKGIISVKSDSKLDAFTGNLIEGTYGEKYYISRVKYSINVKYSSELLNPNIDLECEDTDEIHSLIRQILLDECYEYLKNQMHRVNFDFNPGKTTEEVFNELLNKFSIGQIYSIIYNSITNASRYYLEGNVYKTQAANSVITRCRAYAERIIANEWDIKPFSRPRDCEQSLISALFFNRILSVGDRYFNSVYQYDIFSEMSTSLV